MKLLKISKEISLPIDAVTQTLAAIGRKGAGKTYLATMIAEQMLDAGSQVVVIDPVGNWWGLRVGADGKSKGKDIFVIGGDHGDVPLVPEAGARIAKLLVEKNVSAVLDVSSFRLGERKRFCTDFGEELLHLKKSRRTPVHVFIEEAQLIIPQRVGPDEARMVGAFEQIVRLGRNYGIGCTLITQRPQSVNKEVLSQVECLCVLQVTGPHERKALEEWVQEVGADRKIIGELPGLELGEGFVWSPSWLRVFKRVHFSKKETFDSSSTPQVGKAAKAAKLSSMDVKALRNDMADVVAQAEKDDPAALKKRIRELEKGNTTPTSAPVAMGVSQWREYGKKNGYWDFFEKQALEVANKEIKRLSGILTQIGKLVDKDFVAVSISVPMIQHSQMKPGGIVKVPRPAQVMAPVEGITGPEQKILDAIAWFESIGIMEPEQVAVAFLAGYTYGGGGFNNPRGALRTKGLVEYRGNSLALTESGRSVANQPESSLTQEDLHAKVLSILPGPEKRLLQPLLTAYPNGLTNEELAEASGYTFGSGGFNNPRGKLRTLGLIEYLQGGRVRAKDLLFP